MVTSGSPRGGRSGGRAGPRTTAGHRTRRDRRRAARPRPRRGSRVVELVEDVRVDPARAPLAIPGLGSAGNLDRHVVRVDLGRDPVEQDPPLAPDGRGAGCAASGQQPRRDRLDDRAAELAADLVAAIGDLERDRQDSLGRGQPVGRYVPAEQAREHPAPRRRVGPLAVHHGAGEEALGRTDIGQQGRGSGHERIRLDRRVDDCPAISRGVLKPHRAQPGSPRASSTTWGNVDSQSIARCGSSIASISEIGLVDRGHDIRTGRIAGPAVGDLGQPSGPRRIEVVDIRPLILDLLAEVGQPTLGLECPANEVTHGDAVGAHGGSLAARPIRRRARSVRRGDEPREREPRRRRAGGRMGADDRELERPPAVLVPGPAVRSTRLGPEPGGLGPVPAPGKGVEGVEGDAVEHRQVFGQGGIRSHRLQPCGGCHATP